jgi:GT2 family glycosyltransferase
MKLNKENKTREQRPPRLSVILITMNRQHILKQCLESILRQKFMDYEIVIVDNASIDGTGDMVQRLFPEARYFYLSDNVGAPGARNYGVRKATGEICFFLDDDAVFADNNALEKAMAYFDADHQLGCLAFRILEPHDGLEEYKSIPRADKKIINGDYECSYFCGAGFALRRNVFLEIGMFWEALFFIGEELDFSYRLIDRGYKIVRSFVISVIHYETPQARIPGRWIYFGMRNRSWVAVRNLPWTNVISQMFLWWGNFFILAVRNRYLLYFMQGFKDALAGLPLAMRTRHCISKETISKLKELSGRVYY